MTNKYTTVLRDLSSFESIMSEIDKLDLFNNPNQFKEINDQLYDQYNLQIMIINDKIVPSAKSFNIVKYGKIILESEYSYCYENEAKINALITIAKYIKTNKLVPIEITEDLINKHIKYYNKFYIALPNYIKINYIF